MIDGPEKIDGRGAGCGQAGTDAFEFRSKFLRRPGFGVFRSQDDAVGRGDADGRRAAHHHGDNVVGHLFVGCSEHVALFERELGLIEEADALGGPGQGGNHALPV